MKLEVKRFADNGDTTIGAFYINGIFKCFTIEDQEQKGEKIKGETRIPNGIYNVALRNEGGYNDKYGVKYGDLHKGMLCIYNAPEWKIVTPTHNFQYILIHTGNTDEHTMGCLLTNFTIDGLNFVGGGSDASYRVIYPIISKALLSGEKVTIEYTDVESGK